MTKLETKEELSNNWWIIFLIVILYTGVLIAVGFANQDYIMGRCEKCLNE